MYKKSFLLLLAAASLGSNEGEVVADYEDPGLSVLEERCKRILQVIWGMS